MSERERRCRSELTVVARHIQRKREHDGPTAAAAAGVGDGDGSKRTGREPGSSSADDMQHVSLSICVSLVPRILLPSTGCPLFASRLPPTMTTDAQKGADSCERMEQSD